MSNTPITTVWIEGQEAKLVGLIAGETRPINADGQALFTVLLEDGTQRVVTSDELRDLELRSDDGRYEIGCV